MMCPPMLRLVPTAPFGRPVVPDVYMIVASSSGPTSTSGSVAPGIGVPKSANASSPSCVRADRDDGLHTGLAEPGPDPIQTFVVGEEDDAPECARPYSSSGPVHHALSGTITAPMEDAAQNANAHSG